MVEPTNETKARAIGNNPATLRKRLVESASMLKDRTTFKAATFDFENKRLVSKDGGYALEWRIRKDPTKPEIYENQQTSVETCVVAKLSKAMGISLADAPGKERKL